MGKNILESSAAKSQEIEIMKEGAKLAAKPKQPRKNAKKQKPIPVKGSCSDFLMQYD